MPELGLRQGMKLEQLLYMPSVVSIATMELTQQQIIELVGEILSDIEDGKFDDKKGGKGNYFDTQAFRDKSKTKAAQNIDNLDPEFAIGNDLSVQPITSETRAKIVEALESLERMGPVSFSQIFSQRLLKTLDWTTDARHRILQHLVGVQSEYILTPDNKILLNPQTQDDVAEVVELTASSVSRLVKFLKVSFPDDSVHPVSSLIPGHQIDRIKGEYLLGLLKDDADLYHPERGWKKSSKVLAREISSRFGFEFAPRTVRKYIANLGEQKDYGNKAKENIERIDAIIAEYMERPDLFDSKLGAWKLPAKNIRRLIREERGMVIPKQWIEALTFENCNQSQENLPKRAFSERR